MINLGDKQISDIKLGATNVVSVYQGDTLIWPTKPREPSILVYTTTSANQSVQLTYRKQYFEYIETEDGVEDLSESGALNHTFGNVGEHKVKVLFKKGLTSLYNCFRECTGLTSIPSDLFVNNPEVTNFNVCFYGCSGLTSLPSDLFVNNTKITEFGSCFFGCTGLTSIPDGLFANNPEVTSFSYCFSGCTGLSSIPNDLFVNNTKVISFGSCFAHCTGLTSSTPLDNDGTPLYNRSEGKDGYSVVKYYDNCFYKCTLMSDYSSIPSGWK